MVSGNPQELQIQMELVVAKKHILGHFHGLIVNFYFKLIKKVYKQINSLEKRYLLFQYATSKLDTGRCIQGFQPVYQSQAVLVRRTQDVPNQPK